MKSRVQETNPFHRRVKNGNKCIFNQIEGFGQVARLYKVFVCRRFNDVVWVLFFLLNRGVTCSKLTGKRRLHYLRLIMMFIFGIAINRHSLWLWFRWRAIDRQVNIKLGALRVSITEKITCSGFRKLLIYDYSKNINISLPAVRILIFSTFWYICLLVFSDF